MNNLVKKSNLLHGIEGIGPSFLDKSFDDFVEDFFGWTKQSNQAIAATNIRETDTEYQIDLSIPGFTKENVIINIEDDVLSVSGKIEEQTEENNDVWLRKEFHSQSFSKQWAIPDNAAVDKVSAKFNNGILNIVVEKITPVLPEKKTYQIEIQ